MGENRQNQMKRRIHVSLPVILNALIPRIMIDYINEKLETPSFIHTDGHNIDLTVFIHVSKNGFGAVGHVDISYQNIVYAYGAYDDLSNHLLGAIGDGVLFEVDESSYIDFCLNNNCFLLNSHTISIHMPKDFKNILMLNFINLKKDVFKNILF